MRLLMGLMDQGMLPDTVIRRGIGMLLRRRLRAENRGSIEADRESQRRLIAELSAAPVAVATDTANLQHYELPPEFFAEVLGHASSIAAASTLQGLTTSRLPKRPCWP